MTSSYLLDKQIILREATSSDTEFARAVHHTAMREVVVRQFGTWDEQLQDAFFEKVWVPEKFKIIVFEGVECGYLRIERYATHVEVHELNVQPTHQRRGIGSYLLNDAIAQADRMGLPVCLQTLHQNEAGALYRRHGFKDIAKTDTHIKMRRDALR